jgi:hypothetical protein
MHDDTWWDGDDEGDAIAELQRVLAPLREAPRPWGDVIAQARFVERAPSSRRPFVGALAAAVAAALALGWWWGRTDADAIERADVVDSGLLVNVKAPVVPVPVAAPVVAPAVDPFVELDLSVARLDLAALEYEERRHEGVRKRRNAAPRRAEPHEAVAQDDELPDTLTTNDIKVAMDRIKPAAKACGKKHKAAPREIVKIKLSIAGTTGRPTSVNALDDHKDTALGDCIVELVKTARFPRFRKPALGVIYPFSM